MCGVRPKISGILPASLRAGTITETEGRLVWEGNRGRGLATITLVKARYLKGQSFTRKRLDTCVSSGTGKGKRISCDRLITSQSARLSRLLMSSTVSQF